MVQWGVGQEQPEKLTQRKRIRRAQRNRPLGVQAFEIPDQQEAEVAAWRQSGSPLVRVESLAEAFDVPVEVVGVEDLIQSPAERMRGTAWQVGARYPHRLLL